MREEYIPQKSRDDMANLHKMLTCRPARNEAEGHVKATTDQMTDEMHFMPRG